MIQFIIYNQKRNGYKQQTVPLKFFCLYSLYVQLLISGKFIVYSYFQMILCVIDNYNAQFFPTKIGQDIHVFHQNSMFYQLKDNLCRLQKHLNI